MVVEASPADRRFFETAMKAPLLDHDTERDLARRWREERDEQALHRLISAYMRLVVAIANRFRHYGLPVSDLVQEGSVGLMLAASRFEPEREIRFSTYAVWWIRSCIQEYVLRNWSIVRTGTTSAQKSLFFNFRRLRARLDQGGGPFLSDEDRDRIAAELDVSIAEVKLIEQRFMGADQSLDAQRGGEEGDDPFLDFLADQRPDPEESFSEQHDSGVRRRWLAAAMASLTERERLIVAERRLTEGGRTLEDLGRHLGISKERVRQIESRALRKLHDFLLSRIRDRGDEVVMAGQFA